MTVITIANTALETVANTFGAETVAFRSTTVASYNKATVWARPAIASLLAGLMTPETMTAAIIHAFGNPKSAKGKPVAKLSGLRDVTGGDAFRKTAEAVFAIVANVDSDKSTTGDIRKAVTAFVLNSDGAPKSLAALQSAVKSAIVAHIAATAPDNSEAVADNAAEQATATAAVLPTLEDIETMIASLAVAVQSLQSATDVALAIDAIGDMHLQLFNAAADSDEIETSLAA